MYIWPIFYRIVLAPWLQPELRWPEITTHLLTEDYWSSFGPPLLAIPFLLICGFATVYVLGAKGFCTYGCPYGGFFKPLDKSSPMRVLVNDSCQQCGKCTAACTSNVRVHEEVNQHGMVVDSGCMKITDCIDACPNEALHIGFKKVSIGKHNANRKFDLSMYEELFVTGLFLFGFFAFRGLYATVPMLMAVGLSLVSTWIVWKAARVFLDANVNFHSCQLKFHGKIKKAGTVFIAFATLLISITIHSAFIQTSKFIGDYSLAHNAPLKAMKFYKWASPFEDGGFALASNPNIDIQVAKYHQSQLNFKEAQRLLSRLDWRVGADEQSTMLLGQNIQHYEQSTIIDTFYSHRLAEHPDWELVWEDYVGWLKREGIYAKAIESSMQSITSNPHSLRLKIQLVLLEIDFGDVNHAVSLATELTEHYPEEPSSWMLLSRSLHASGNRDGAIAAQMRAAEIQGEQPRPPE
jgi:NAD-dependent dihydropyrimidine dehydrogenase PreA subunit